jgi:hypothetical protein
MALTHVDITLDKPRRLRFDINALIDIENVSGGKSIQQVLGNMGIGTIRLLMWAGLKHDDRRLTQEKTGELLQEHLDAGGDIVSLVDILTEAMDVSGVFGKPSGNGGAPNREMTATSLST